MPYIAKHRRNQINDLIEKLLSHDNGALNSGEINYIFSIIIDKHIEEHGLSYNTINSLIGVLECCKLELYRRVAAPYEDKKKVVNGDVYSGVNLG